MTKDKALTDSQCDEFRRLPMSFNDMVRAIYKAGQEALAETQEPVAMVEVRNGAIIPLSLQQYAGCEIANGTVQLYTAPPSREWVGLSDEEINELWYKSQNDIEGVILGFTTQQHFFASAIEAKLKEKNNG